MTKKKNKSKIRKHINVYSYMSWAGVGLLLVNYILLAAGLLSGNTVTYHLLSLVGSSCIAIESWILNDKQPALLNMIFSVIAVLAVVRIATL